MSLAMVTAGGPRALPRKIGRLQFRRRRRFGLEPRSCPGSFLTLHYRLAGADGADIISTFDDQPATLSIGSGELVPAVEARLLGLPRAARDRSPRRRRRVRRAQPGAAAAGQPRAARRHGESDGDYRSAMWSSSRARRAGRCRRRRARGRRESLMIDFNHPLAGQPVTFEVQLIGVL